MKIKFIIIILIMIAVSMMPVAFAGENLLCQDADGPVIVGIPVFMDNSIEYSRGYIHFQDGRSVFVDYGRGEDIEMIWWNRVNAICLDKNRHIKDVKSGKNPPSEPIPTKCTECNWR